MANDPLLHSFAPWLLMALTLSGCAPKPAKPVGPRTETPRPFEQLFRQDDVLVSLRLTTPRPTVADLIGLELLVEAASGVEVELPVLPHEIADLLVKSSHDLGPVPAGDDRARRGRVWQLEALVASDYHLPSLEVRYRKEAESAWRAIRTRELSFEVFSALGASLDPTRIRPAPPPQDLPLPAWAAWLQGGATAALAGSAAVLGMLFVRRWATRRRSPLARARRALAALEQCWRAAELPPESVYPPLVRSLREVRKAAGGPEQIRTLIEALDRTRFCGRPPSPTAVREDLARARAWLEAELSSERC